MSVEGLPPQLAQCSVTGKMVPEDELVEINGQRVCAEGKAILIQRLKAGDAMPGELEKPTVIRRFGSILLDGLIFGIPTAIVTAVLIGATGSRAMQGIVSFVAACLQIVYFGQLHASRGQTLGKMAGKIKVVNLDGSPLSIQTAYIRSIAYVGPNLLNSMALLIGLAPFMLVTSVIVMVWALADVIFALVDTAQQRSLHDRIASTRVVVAQ